MLYEVITFEEVKWARPWLEDQLLGPNVKRVTDVLRRGDVVLVEALAAGDGKNGEKAET